MSVSPLATLIHESQELFEQTHGVRLSYAAIATRSGGRLVRNWVRQLATRPIKALPSPEVIKGLSLGLGVPESTVLERALASAGYTTPIEWHQGTGETARVNYAALASDEAPDQVAGLYQAKTWGGQERPPTDPEGLRNRLVHQLADSQDTANLIEYLAAALAEARRAETESDRDAESVPEQPRRR